MFNARKIWCPHRLFAFLHTQELTALDQVYVYDEFFHIPIIEETETYNIIN